MKTARDSTHVALAAISSGYVTINHSGRDFTASTAMAEIFRRRSREVLASGHAELVPLLHSDGVELLLVGLGSERISA